MKSTAYLVLIAATGLAAYCFTTDRIVLGAINSAIALANVILLARH